MTVSCSPGPDCVCGALSRLSTQPEYLERDTLECCSRVSRLVAEDRVKWKGMGGKKAFLSRMEASVVGGFLFSLVSKIWQHNMNVFGSSASNSVNGPI